MSELLETLKERNRLKRAGLTLEKKSFLSSINWSCESEISQTEARELQRKLAKKQWDNAIKPNKREKASFLKENILPIQESWQLKLIEEETEIYPGIELKLFNGHTLGQVIPHIKYKSKTIVYCGDLFPTSAHIPIPYVMSYDMFPLQTLDEKERFLNEAVKNDYIIFFEHDIFHECCNLELTERGIKSKEFFKLEEIFLY